MYIITEHHLEHPICDCFYKEEFPHYTWGTFLDERNNKRGLRIYCEICKTVLEIPGGRFKARVTVHNYDKDRKEYSQTKAGQNQEEKKPNLKVLEFPEPKRTQSLKD